MKAKSFSEDFAKDFEKNQKKFKEKTRKMRNIPWQRRYLIMD